jgi:hypothetical protein
MNGTRCWTSFFFAATVNAVVFTDVARRQQSLTRVAGTCEKPFELVEIVI